MEKLKKIRLSNMAVAAMTAAALALLVFLFRYPILPPSTWEDLAAGAGLRPPTNVLGGFVRGLYAPIFTHFPGPSTALLVIQSLGWVFTAVITLTVYQILSLTHPFIQRLTDDSLGARMTHACLAGSCVLFVCNDVVWSCVQALGAASLHLTVILIAVWLTFKFSATGKRRFALTAMFLYTALVGETALGYIGALWTVTLAMRIDRSDKESALKNPLARMFFRRVLMLEFFAVAALALYAEYRLFTVQGGVFAEEESGLLLFITTYIGSLLDTIHAAATWKHWVLAFLAVIAPFLVLLRFYKRDFAGDNFIPNYRIAVYIGIGIVSWTQACGIPELSFRYWMLNRTAMSPVVFALFTLLSVITLLWTVLLFVVRLNFDTARDMAAFHFDDESKTDIGRRILRIMTLIERYAKPGVLCLSAATLLTALCLRYEGRTRQMLTLIGDYLRETIRECKGLERLVTDGALDAALELTAFREGQTLYTLSMTAGLKPRDIELRRRGIDAPDDRESLRTGFPNTLRGWIGNSSPVLQTLGTQLALDMWRKVPRKDRPTVYGTVARLNKDLDEIFRTQSWGRDFAQRVIDVYEDGPHPKTIDRRIYEAFLFVQFRTARFCQWRAEAAGIREWGEDSQLEQSLADRLDKLNPSYQTAKQLLLRASDMRNVTLTPRENLRICLENADFNAAVPFAELVIQANPADPEANWALGMHHFQQRNFVHAEPYLTRCLKERPQDPAVLNNLAIVEREIRRLDAAEKHIREGLEILPESPHLHRTLDSILKAKGLK